MNLTLREAAAQLGKSERQVRYLIQKGELVARKVEGRWQIDHASLDAKPTTSRRTGRKIRQLRSLVESALEVPTERQKRFSLRDLKAFQIALPLYRRASEALGDEHPATIALHGSLDRIAAGCHRFDDQEKRSAYNEARDFASKAACALLVDSRPETEPLLDEIEQELMASLAGLLRRVERRRKWR